jgi:ATP-dependent Clp protease adaptor protein ClpS
VSDTLLDTTTKTAVRSPAMWTVIFLNDDYTPMLFVAQMLVSVFHKSADEAQQITLAIHHEGRASIGSYTHEVASNKADRAMLLAAIAQHPLQVFPERL